MTDACNSPRREQRVKPPYTVDWPTLLQIREEHTGCVGPGDSILATANELRQCWLRVAEAELERTCTGPIKTRDQEFIDIRVQQSVREVDLVGNGKVDVDMWCNHMLLTRSNTATMRAVMQINRLFDAALEACPSMLIVLQHAFEVAVVSSVEPPEVTHGEGRLPVHELVAILARRLWHLRPTPKESAMKRPSDFSHQTPDEFIKHVVQGLELDANCSHATCADFLALCLGRRERPVMLHLYDLSRGAATMLAPWLINQELEGVWHSGIIVYGKEYYFGGDIYFDTPGETGFGTPRLAIHLGSTLRQRDELHTFVVDELKATFTREAYDPARNNCNHFTDRVSMFLVGRHIPEEVLRQPELMLETRLGRALRPVLTYALGQYFEPKGSAEEISSCSLGRVRKAISLPAMPGEGEKDTAGEIFQL